MNNKGLIKADWSVPTKVNAFVSTKQHDVDAYLQQKSVQWLQQVHGTEVFHLNSDIQNTIPEADAIYTQVPDVICGIHTADCLPVFFSDQQGREIALAHAGWRGLAAGVLENTLDKFKAKREQIVVWFGPAIGPCHFEVGEEVRALFLQESDPELNKSISSAFKPRGKPGKWRADLYKLAQARLHSAGVVNISGGSLCTYCDPANFYSYRRDKDAGRLSSLIWLN
jgi:YfiH family protein